MTAAVAPDGALAGPGAARPPLGARPDRPRARRKPPSGLLALSILVAGVLVVPLAFLLVEAAGAGIGQVASLIDRQLTEQLLWNTIRLGVVVTALCAVIGTGTAWLTERTNLPGRRVWAVLLVVPLAIPDFVVSFGWASISTDVAGFRGAVLVMTLSVYPLVYLPVAASFRNADPTQEEVARSLGAGPVKTFFRITLGQAKVAILGGCLLVVMVMLAEYGAFNILGYQTFTTEIFTEFQQLFDIASACALSLVLVALSLLVLGADAVGRRRGRVSRASRTAQRAVPRTGWACGPRRCWRCSASSWRWPWAYPSGPPPTGGRRARTSRSRARRCWAPPVTRPPTAPARPRWPRPWRCRWQFSRYAAAAG